MRKTHTCCYCGAVYTYALKRRVSGGHLTPNAAGRKAEKSAAEVWRNGAEIKPCPNCGRCQSEMFADSTWARFAMPWARSCALFMAMTAYLPFVLFTEAEEIFRDNEAWAGLFAFGFMFLLPYGSWLYLTARLLPTFWNFNRKPELNLERMKTDEALRSELLGIRTKWARKQDVKRGWFIVSASLYGTFSFFYLTPIWSWLAQITLGIDCVWAPWALLGALVPALAFLIMIKNVPDSVRFQGDKPLTTNANEETTALLREHWRELLETREAQEATRKD